jgi:hypothetical protein
VKKKKEYAGLVGSALVGGAALEVSCSFCGEQAGHNGSCDDVLHLLTCHAMSVTCCMVLMLIVTLVVALGVFAVLSGPAGRRKKKEEMKWKYQYFILGRWFQLSERDLFEPFAYFISLNHKRERKRKRESKKLVVGSYRPLKRPLGALCLAS